MSSHHSILILWLNVDNSVILILAVMPSHYDIFVCLFITH